MEANRHAFVSTPHIAEDPAGTTFGLGHYSLLSNTPSTQMRVTNGSQACPYGPASTCAIDTNFAFDAAWTFAQPGSNFHWNVTLTQGGRTVEIGPVQYIAALPEALTTLGITKEQVIASDPSVPRRAGHSAVQPCSRRWLTVWQANTATGDALAAGMTIVSSYWNAGGKADGMDWLDHMCTAEEHAPWPEGWGCEDAWTANPEAFVDENGEPLICGIAPFETAGVAAQCGTSWQQGPIKVA